METNMDIDITDTDILGNNMKHLDIAIDKNIYNLDTIEPNIMSEQLIHAYIDNLNLTNDTNIDSNMTRINKKIESLNIISQDLQLQQNISCKTMLFEIEEQYENGIIKFILNEEFVKNKSVFNMTETNIIIYGQIICDMIDYINSSEHIKSLYFYGINIIFDFDIKKRTIKKNMKEIYIERSIIDDELIKFFTCKKVDTFSVKKTALRGKLHHFSFWKNIKHLSLLDLCI